MSRKTENKKYIAKKQLNRQSIAFRLDHDILTYCLRQFKKFN